MGVTTETAYNFTCDRCPSTGTYACWGDAYGGGWRRVAIFDDQATRFDDLSWSIICPDDVATLRAWLQDSMRGLM